MNTPPVLFYSHDSHPESSEILLNQDHPGAETKPEYTPTKNKKQSKEKTQGKKSEKKSDERKLENSQEKPKKSFQTQLISFKIQSNPSNLRLSYDFSVEKLANHQLVQDGFNRKFLKSHRFLLFDVLFSDLKLIEDYANKNSLSLTSYLQLGVTQPKTEKYKLVSLNHLLNQAFNHLLNNSNMNLGFQQRAENLLVECVGRGGLLKGARWDFGFNQKNISGDEFTGLISFIKTLKKRERLIENKRESK